MDRGIHFGDWYASRRRIVFPFCHQQSNRGADGFVDGLGFSIFSDGRWTSRIGLGRLGAFTRYAAEVFVRELASVVFKK